MNRIIWLAGISGIFFAATAILYDGGESRIQPIPAATAAPTD